MSRTSFAATPMLCAAVLTASLCLQAQEGPGAAKQPLDHILGAVTAVDLGAHTVTVKEDKTGSSQTILLANAKTLLKVEPGAKDLKSAVRITADDLQVGDRVDCRGLKTDAADTLAARSVVLMSGRDLQQARQAQAAAWQRATVGTVSAVDVSTGKITLNAKTPEGAKSLVIETAKTTEFIRYSPEDPKNPLPSQLAQIQSADQLRVIGDKSEDGATIKAQRVYSGAFRTVSATISAIGADGKSLTIKDLATKKPVEVSLNNESVIRRLPPQMAAMLARRYNPDFKPAAPAGGQGGPNAAPAAAGGAPAGWQHGGGEQHAGGGTPGGWQGAQGGAGGGRTGDISQMLEHVPKIALGELKAGDALVISGVALGADNSRLLATGLIAGVEPILQSAPQRQGSVGGDWGLSGEMAAPQ